MIVCHVSKKRVFCRVCDNKAETTCYLIGEKTETIFSLCEEHKRELLAELGDSK